ncbi:hypothetical protein ACKC9G_03565 [Pokkaliibacter sp. CJK22405]|uniref:hypothetical protein n=1 Tax=Pokkaliibacter sp. CJK22405 TaxID=3384615 RepID=UPI003984FF51
MIFFGSRGKMLTGGQIEGPQCSHCQHSLFNVFGVIRYFHLYWIPVFPTSKKPGMECAHCKKALIGDELPEVTRKALKRELFTRKRMLPSFTGLIILLVAFVAAGISVSNAENKENSYLAMPKAGDYYIVKLKPLLGDDLESKYPFGILQIQSVSGEDIEFKVGGYSYNKKRGAEKAISEHETDEQNYFVEQTKHLTQQELIAFQHQGAIKSIERPE